LHVEHFCSPRSRPCANFSAKLGNSRRPETPTGGSAVQERQPWHDIRFKTVWMAKTLFILNDSPYGTERSYNGLRLAPTGSTENTCSKVIDESYHLAIATA
jgi:hypothetical protein